MLAHALTRTQLLGIANHTEQKIVEEIFTFPAPPSYAQRQIHDGSVYVPETDTIFVAELFSPKPGHSMRAIPYVWKIDISNHSSPVVQKAYPNPPLTIANGATYFNGSVYWAQEGNYTTPSAIVRMDPTTLKTEIVKNNFYGHRFNSLNDIVISQSGIAFFTDGYYGYDNFNDTLLPRPWWVARTPEFFAPGLAAGLPATRRCSTSWTGLAYF